MIRNVASQKQLFQTKIELLDASRLCLTSVNCPRNRGLKCDQSVVEHYSYSLTHVQQITRSKILPNCRRKEDDIYT